MDAVAPVPRALFTGQKSFVTSGVISRGEGSKVRLSPGLALSLRELVQKLKGASDRKH